MNRTQRLRLLVLGTLVVALFTPAVLAGDSAVKTRLSAATFAPTLDAEGCVDINVGVDPGQACPGWTVNVPAKVANCGSEKDRITIKAAITGFSPSYIGTFTLGAGDSVTVSPKVTIPMNTLPGKYTLLVYATSRNGGKDEASATLEVLGPTACDSGVRH